jgi:hypothetical protein
MRKIVKHVIALMKYIWIIKPPTERGFMAQFMVGKRHPFIFTGGIGLSWWYTKSSFKTGERIVSMIADTLAELKNCDLGSVEDANDSDRNMYVGEADSAPRVQKFLL